jgi:hypothetical protein
MILTALNALNQHKGLPEPPAPRYNEQSPEYTQYWETRRKLARAALNEAAINFTNIVDSIGCNDAHTASHFRHTIVGFANLNGWLIQYNS